jgi:hypothetical protein
MGRVSILRRRFQVPVDIDAIHLEVKSDGWLVEILHAQFAIEVALIQLQLQGAELQRGVGAAELGAQLHVLQHVRVGGAWDLYRQVLHQPRRRKIFDPEGAFERGLVQNGERLTFGRFLLYGLPITLAQLTVGALYVVAMFWLMR